MTNLARPAERVLVLVRYFGRGKVSGLELAQLDDVRVLHHRRFSGARTRLQSLPAHVSDAQRKEHLGRHQPMRFGADPVTLARAAAIMNKAGFDLVETHTQGIRVAGTVGAINPFDETVNLNELITDQAVIVHINPAGLRLISPGPERFRPEDGMGEFVLQAIDFGDIREGDSVIVLGRQSEPSGTKIDGLTLIVNFGEPALRGLSQQVTWKLMPVSLDLP